MSIDVQHTAPVTHATGGWNGLGDMADVAFALAAYQLDALDSDLAMRLEGMKQLMEIKKAYRERISALQEALKELSGTDTKTWIEEDLARKSEFAWDGSSGRVSGASGDLIGDDRFRLVDEEGNGIAFRAFETERGLVVIPAHYKTLEGAREQAAAIPGSRVQVQVTRQDLETEIARLQGKLDELSGEGEIGLLAINRLLGKRNQVLQLASNVMSSSHQGAMGIIANIK